MKVVTDHPVAIDSHDHIEPKGTKADNTHCPKFVEKSEKVFGKSSLIHLDLGCSGGGLVKDFLDKCHLSIGIEGSDYSKIHKRAEWATIPKNLFTADITKPFSVLYDDETPITFDLITAWEVMEHIKGEGLPQLIENIKKHLRKDGLFVCSIATFPDGEWHVTLEDKTWWTAMFKYYELVVKPADYQTEDYVRRGSFHLVLGHK